jgi:hypothetical protein
LWASCIVAAEEAHLLVRKSLENKSKQAMKTAV